MAFSTKNKILYASIWLFGAFFAMPANAACLDLANLLTSKLYLDISDNGCTKLEIAYTNKIQKDGQPNSDSIKRYSFEDECKLIYNNEQNITGFSCHKKGNTPLAGAIYKKKPYGTIKMNCGDLGTWTEKANKYVCVSGCNSFVPKFLNETLTCD
jgi:hypothetical protein